MNHSTDKPSTAVNEKGLPEKQLLLDLLRESAERHQHLCPRQVLGVRLGLSALLALGLVNKHYLPRFRNHDKRLLTIVETDGCGADGIAVATDCTIGHRTLRVNDIGKVAATIVDVKTGSAIRVSPKRQAREVAIRSAPSASNNWHAYLQSYQTMPDAQLVQSEWVSLITRIEEIISSPEFRAICKVCGEEIINGRELYLNGTAVCRTCAGQHYYKVSDLSE